ncbi:LacI family DNA-binding transcriptional regulator [Halalkalibacter urbisdiaboli]|uniref:LacI family DNA-binding transcriptional regulator n=1 Tax=Halalkalibacter urbisdiaboli TaxID=1960589 RepID=UPI000B439B32|nr:LacI family DNA-binding transcriptional regulator [Halalkalibacter urbisdiaboli]
MATIYDVAKLAEVSPMTVSRVINQKGPISEATKLKVEQAIEALNYIPNKSAQSLVSKKTKILSLLITDISNPFFTKVARGAEDKALQLGYQVIFSNSDEDIEKESKYIQMLLESRVDGVLMAPSGDQSRKNVKKLIKSQIPFVLLDREIDGVDSDIVLGNSYEGTRNLIDHLVEQGHKKIALINGPTYISTARERKRAYIETLQFYNLPIDEALIFETDYKQQSETTIIDKLMVLPPEQKPTAIFAANNFIAVTMMKKLKERGVNVPNDIAFVCFDDFDPVMDYHPFFTVAAQPAYDFGYLGTQILIDKIEGNSSQTNRRIVLPPEIVIRESSLRHNKNPS